MLQNTLFWHRTRILPCFAVALAALSLSSELRATSHNATPDLPWSGGRPNQCCGTIAASNLIILLDELAGRMVGDNTTTDKLHDEVEKATNDDADKNNVSNKDMIDGINKLLKDRGYSGTVQSIFQEGAAAVSFQRVITELAANERLMLLIESQEGNEKQAAHWVTVTGADNTNRRISVTDPNTEEGESTTPRTPGRADTYDVGGTDFTFTLGYDFGSEKTAEGSTVVKVVDIIKVSDVVNQPIPPKGTGGGTTNGTGTIKTKSGGSRLSIDPILINSLFLDSSIPGGIDPTFSSDPILGAQLLFNGMRLLNPSHVLTEGALLSGGTIGITLGSDTLFSATFDAFTMFDGTELGVNQAILDDVLFNNTIGSDWLEAYALQFEQDPNLLAQLVLQPTDESQSLLAQLDFFQDTLTTPVSLGAFLTSTDFVPSELTNIITVTGRSLAVGIDLPEPGAWLLLLIGFAGVGFVRRIR